ncbi:MAG: hypothetical protein KF799_15010 [Bdellovibrionales bacterium]|nr:hypothetical protein [Bdellovibrionales bacterium]
MIKRALALFLAFSVSLPAFAGVTRSNADMMALIDDYIKEVASTPANADQTYMDMQAAFLAEAVGLQVRTLEPEDFNLFMLAVMSRYINKPEEREALFKFIEGTRQWIAADLANTAQLEKGALHYMNPANYSWYTWVVIGAGVVIGGRVLHGPLRTTRFVQGLDKMQMAAAKWRAPYRIAFRSATHPITLATATGAGLGLLEYQLEKNKTHRLDPMILTNAVQTELACYASYQGLGLEERFESIRDDEEKLKAGFAGLNADIDKLMGETQVLLKQYARLDNLYLNEPGLQAARAKLPQASDFQDLRRLLNAKDAAATGPCAAVSLTHLVIALERMKTDLKTYHDVYVPTAAQP